MNEKVVWYNKNERGSVAPFPIQIQLLYTLFYGVEPIEQPAIHIPTLSLENPEMFVGRSYQELIDFVRPANLSCAIRRLNGKIQPEPPYVQDGDTVWADLTYFKNVYREKSEFEFLYKSYNIVQLFIRSGDQFLPLKTGMIQKNRIGWLVFSNHNEVGAKS